MATLAADVIVMSASPTRTSDPAGKLARSWTGQPNRRETAMRIDGLSSALKDS